MILAHPLVDTRGLSDQNPGSTGFGCKILGPLPSDQRGGCPLKTHAAFTRADRRQSGQLNKKVRLLV